MYGTFDCTVSIVDERRRETISAELYERRKADLGGDAVIADLDTEDEDLIGFDPLEPGLPAASSDRQKWWLDNKQTARAHIPVPSGRNGQPMSLNPHRPSNPFPATDEPDWVSVSRGSPGAASSLSSSPYEKVPMPMPRTMSMASNASSSAAAAGVRRQVPPPFDPSKLPAQVGRLSVADDQVSTRSTDSERQQPPPPPPPRRRAVGQQQQQHEQQPATPTRPESSASQQSAGGGNKPPIARKPAHLAGSSPVAARSPATQQQPPLPPRRETLRKPLPPPAESLL